MVAPTGKLRINYRSLGGGDRSHRTIGYLSRQKGAQSVHRRRRGSVTTRVGYKNGSFFREHFKELYGCSMEQYRIALRINKAKTMIKNENKTLKQVSLELGYRDVYFFNKQFKQQTGMSPAKYVMKQKTDFH